MSMAVFVALACFALGSIVLVGQPVPGWSFSWMTACLFGALNALGIAILGEYVIRIYDQVRARPLMYRHSPGLSILCWA